MAVGDVHANLTNPLAKRGAMFDGVDDYVEVPHNANQLGTNLTNGFTISAWIYMKSSGEGSVGRVIDKSTATNASDGFYLRSGTNQVKFRLNAGTEAQTAGDITFGGWHHITVTVTAAGLCNIYKNGTITGSANQNLGQATSTITTTNAPRIGNLTGATTTTLDGTIGKVKMWNKVLTTAERALDYAGREVKGTIIDVPLQKNYDGVTNSGSRLVAIDDQVATAVKTARALGGATDHHMIAFNESKVFTVEVEET